MKGTTAPAPRRDTRDWQGPAEGEPSGYMMDFSLAAVLPQIFTGLVLGMIFVLLAIGLSLIFGLMTVVNFSHGALYMLGAYFTVFVLTYTRSFLAALVLAPLLVGTVGLPGEAFLHRGLFGRHPGEPPVRR